jgi:tetratricopeptide (TPR) repeat protein
MKLNCSACGALNDSLNSSQCSYCGNSLIIQENDFERRVNILDSHGNKFRLAEVAFEGENYDEAISYYNSCLEIDPSFFESWLKKGLSQLFTSSIGNMQATQAVATLKQALIYSDNKEALKLRIKKVTIPFALNYYKVCVNHFLSFMTVNDIGSSVSFMLGKANSLVEFLYQNCELTEDELVSIYNEVMAADKSFRKAVLSTMFDKSKNGVFDQILIVLKNTESVSEELFKRIQKLNPSFQKTKKGACFIATAATGDYNHPAVVELRSFRDNWLLKRKWGINFTKWYYHNGPKAAQVIEKSAILRKLTFIVVVKPLQLLTKKLN